MKPIVNNYIVLFLSFGFYLTCVYSCGSKAPCYSTARLGSCCAEDTDCGEYSCLPGFPDGYCSVSCEGNHRCPEDSHCIRIEYGGSSSGLSGEVCLAACGAGLVPCREGYRCEGIETKDIRVCFPE